MQGDEVLTIWAVIILGGVWVWWRARNCCAFCDEPFDADHCIEGQGKRFCSDACMRCWMERQ